MNALMYIGIFMAGFLILLLTVKKERAAYDYMLMGWLAMSGLNLLFFYNDFNFETKYIKLELAGALLPFVVAPFLYFYVCALVLPRKFQFKRYLYHFIPYLFMYGSMLYFFDQVYSVEDGFIQVRATAPWQLRWYGMILAGSGLLYPSLSLFLLFRHRGRIENEFSNIEKINLNWLRYWITLSMIGFWFSFAIIWAGSFQWVDFLTSFQGVATSLVINIAVIGFYGVKQSTIFTNLQERSPLASADGTKTERYASSKLASDEASQLVKKLQQYMDAEKPYLDSQLSLEGLAHQTGMTKHDLSQIINDKLNTNFFGFVNEYRVRDFKQRLTDPQFEHYTLLGIALETGFNSKSSFNGIFKKSEGITPSQYKRSLKPVH